MTVCIAAICKDENNEYIVISTDRMIDVGIGQFEHDIKKYKSISTNTVAMLAGNSLLYNELFLNIDPTQPYSEIKNHISNQFDRVKDEQITNNLLKPINLTKTDVKNGIVQGTMINNPVMGKLVEQILKFRLNTGVLLVGFDCDEAKISEITEFGCGDFSQIHSYSIGIGQTQAINTLLFQKQSKSDTLNQTIYNVFKAKKNSEVVSGVGRGTDLLVVTKNKTITISDSDLNKLNEIYKKELDFGRYSQDLNNLEILKNKDVMQVVSSE